MAAAYGSYEAYPAKGNAPELLTRTTVIKGNLGGPARLLTADADALQGHAQAPLLSLQPCLNPLARRLGLRCSSLGLCEGCGLSAPGEPWTEGQCQCRCPIRAPRAGRCRALCAPPEEAERFCGDRRGAGGVTARGVERTSGSVRAWLGAADAIWGALTGPLRRFCSGAASPPRCCTFGSVPVRGSAGLTGSAFAMLTNDGCG